MTTLSVNLNKIAVLRNSRGDELPSVTEAARVCLSAGCRGITLHPRPDQRHVRPHDVAEVAALLPEGIELNIEGNPFAPPTAAGYPGLMALAQQARPAQVTLVPDADGQLTSDHGFDLRRDAERLAPLVARFRDLGCRVSLFVDAGSQGFQHAARIGAQRIEIYTGPYAKAFARGDAGAETARCRNTALGAQSAGLAVNAGHDLNQRNLAPFLRAVPQVLEVSIGHALIGEALYDGLAPTVRNYLAVIAAAVSPH